MKLWRYGRPIETLGQRYRLEGVLGSGGMAEVCLAWDEREQRQVAIKVLKSDAFERADPHDQQMLNRFVKEAGQVVGWQHPHILRVYDHTQVEILDEADQKAILFYIVMEYAQGGDLQKRMTPGEAYASLSAALTVFRQICGAVQYAHKHGVIHRDIKPLNILFRQNRTGPEEAVLSDFGLAVQVDASHHTFAEAGTFAYMAPEQFRGQAQPASDIFALGVTLYQLCTGHLPFRREMKDLRLVLSNREPDPLPPSQLNADLPPVLDEPILQAMQVHPADRYRSAAVFWNKLAAVLAETKLPSERRAAGAQTHAQLSQPLSLLTIKVSNEEPVKGSASEESEGGATRAAPELASPKPIVLQPAPDAPAKRRPRPLRSVTQARSGKRRRFPRFFITAAIGSGLLLLIALLALALPPLFAASATVTLIPRSQVEQQTTTVSSTQLRAHQLTAQANPQSKTVPVSGTLPATKAHGTLEFLNNGSVDVTIPTQTFVSKSGVSITFQGPIMVPAANPPEATTTGFAVNAGPGGNIAAFDLLQYCCAPNHAIQVRNPETFTGGANAQPNDQVQQSDITSAANPFITSQTQNEQKNLKSQIKSDEQIVSDSQHCQPTVKPNVPAGTQAKTVTVTVSVTCTAEVYNVTQAQTLATNLLSQQAQQQHLGATYQLAGHVAASVTPNGDQLTLNARGIWAYTFPSARLNQLAALIAGKSQASTRTLLLKEPGVADVHFSTSGTLPSADHIQIKVQPPVLSPP